MNSVANIIETFDLTLWSKKLSARADLRRKIRRQMAIMNHPEVEIDDFIKAAEIRMLAATECKSPNCRNGVIHGKKSGSFSSSENGYGCPYCARIRERMSCTK